MSSFMLHPDNSRFTSNMRATSRSKELNHGIFLQVHRRDMSVFSSLSSYRLHNPSTPAHMVADGGDHFEDFAEHFHCTYVRKQRRLGAWSNRNADTNHFFWLERVYEACKTTLRNVQWVVIFENDVFCYKPPTEEPRYSLNGGDFGPHWANELLDLLAITLGPNTLNQGHRGLKYTGCGGSIFNREEFLTCFDQLSYSLYEQGFKRDSRILLAADAAISFTFQISGRNTGAWSDFARYTDPNVEQYAFVHGDKRDYGRPFENFPPQP
jgi:hypothetical protein